MKMTERMRQVLDRIAKGETNDAIAKGLGISPKTVEKHRKKLYDKFEVGNAVSLVVAALKQKEIVL